MHIENGGLVSARKAGVGLATGKYVAYVDGDDWISPDLYQDFYEKGIKYNVDMVCAGGYIKEYLDDSNITIKNNLGNVIYNRENLEKKVFPHFFFTNFFYKTDIQVSLCTHIFRRELIYRNQNQVDRSILSSLSLGISWQQSENIAAPSFYSLHCICSSPHLIQIPCAVFL